MITRSVTLNLYEPISIDTVADFLDEARSLCDDEAEVKYDDDGYPTVSVEQ